MNVQYNDFGLYTVNTEYLRYLYEHDSEVQFSEHKPYEKKPFVGIIAFIGAYTYFIPLTSAKQKHSHWKLVGKEHYLIYNIVDKARVAKKDIIKPYNDGEVIKIFAAIDIKKMIPVPNGLYSKIDFDKIDDDKYRDLLMHEFLFCQGIQDGILAKAKEAYIKQKFTSKVFPMFCNYAKLEQACNKYIAQ